MDELEKYAKIAYRYFGSVTEKYILESFTSMHDDLKRANISLTTIEYLSLAIATSVVVFVCLAPSLSLIFGILMVGLSSFPAAQAILLGVFAGTLGGLFSATGIFLLYAMYPGIVVGERKKKIDDSLTFAILYLSTIAGSGAPPITMFRTLSKFKEYGEISEEAKRIVYDTDVLGINFSDALENAANRTPSVHLRDVLWGIRSVVTVGGDLEDFLHEKSAGALQEYKRRLSQFTEQLSMFIEMYITIVIVGSIFFLVMSTIMSSMSAGSAPSIVVMQLLVTFIALPFASLGFLVLIKGIAPSST